MILLNTACQPNCTFVEQCKKNTAQQFGMDVLLLYFVLLALVPCFALVMSPYMAPSSYHVNRIGMGNTLFHAKQLKGTTERDTWPGSLASLTFQIL